MTKNSESMGNTEMMSMMANMMQGLEQLSDEEKHRVLDAIYAFYALKQDPTFRLSDVHALLAKIGEVVGAAAPDLVQKGVGMMQQGMSPPTAGMPFIGEPPEPSMEQGEVWDGPVHITSSEI
jgi:hypothetical protein